MRARKYTPFWRKRNYWPPKRVWPLDHEGYPKHDRVMRVPPGAEVGHWSVKLQIAAVNAGFFLERCPGYLGFNRVNVVPLRIKDTPFEHCADPREAFDVLYATFRDTYKLNDPDALGALNPIVKQALDFIKQQDEYGWSGTWDVAVQYFSMTMRWYKFRSRKRRGIDARRLHAVQAKIYNHIGESLEYECQNALFVPIGQERRAWLKRKAKAFQKAFREAPAPERRDELRAAMQNEWASLRAVDRLYLKRVNLAMGV